jgi:hypothetical protein
LWHCRSSCHVQQPLNLRGALLLLLLLLLLVHRLPGDI